jgi:nucleotidyltransferase substrate binding protein (TIGR01987 family)
MERLKQRLAVAKTALASFQDILRKTPANRVERDAAVQRFEYTTEAVWRAAQRFLEVVEGFSIGSPKGTIRLCREVGLLSDAQAARALEMIDDRNLTVHTYNERLAKRIDRHLPRYAELSEQWLMAMTTTLKPSSRPAKQAGVARSRA